MAVRPADRWRVQVNGAPCRRKSGAESHGRPAGRHEEVEEEGSAVAVAQDEGGDALAGGGAHRRAGGRGRFVEQDGDVGVVKIGAQPEAVSRQGAQPDQRIPEWWRVVGFGAARRGVSVTWRSRTRALISRARRPSDVSATALRRRWRPANETALIQYARGGNRNADSIAVTGGVGFRGAAGFPGTPERPRRLRQSPPSRT